MNFWTKNEYFEQCAIIRFNKYFFNIIFLVFGDFQLQRSDDRTIVLRDLHVDMTGKYTCEVSTEGIFETVKDMAKMTVIGKLINYSARKKRR